MLRNSPGAKQQQHVKVAKDLAGCATVFLYGIPFDNIMHMGYTKFNIGHVFTVAQKQSSLSKLDASPVRLQISEFRIPLFQK